MRIVQNSNNIIRVLKKIHTMPGISRIEISKQIGLDKSTVTVIADRLIKLGFIEKTSVSLTPYIGGRKPIGLKIREDIGVILGLEINTDYYTAVLIDLTGKVYSTLHGKIPGNKNFSQCFLEIYKEIYCHIEETGLKLLGIGIGAPGLIDPHNGIIRESNPMGIHEPENFYDEIKPFFQIPVFIENDANCGCWAELAYSKINRPRNFMFVLGEFRKARFYEDNSRILAIGLGIVIDERVHYGINFSAGEYQSPQWNPPNKTQFSVTDQEFSGINSDHAIVEMIAGELSRDIAFLANVLNLNRIIIGGGIAEYFSDIKHVLGKEILRNWSYSKKPDIELKASAMKGDTIAFGAATMLIENLFLSYETQSENPWSQKVGVDLFNSFADTINR